VCLQAKNLVGSKKGDVRNDPTNFDQPKDYNADDCKHTKYGVICWLYGPVYAVSLSDFNVILMLLLSK
jgi:hypothetical protein